MSRRCYVCNERHFHGTARPAPPIAYAAGVRYNVMMTNSIRSIILECPRACRGGRLQQRGRA